MSHSGAETDGRRARQPDFTQGIRDRQPGTGWSLPSFPLIWDLAGPRIYRTPGRGRQGDLYVAESLTKGSENTSRKSIYSKAQAGKRSKSLAHVLYDFNEFSRVNFDRDDWDGKVVNTMVGGGASSEEGGDPGRDRLPGQEFQGSAYFRRSGSRQGAGDDY